MLEELAAAHEILRKDRCTIARSVKATKPNGTTGQAFETIAEDIPCRISQPGKPENVQGLPDPTTEAHAKLFCAKDVDIRAGDKITVTRGSFTGTYEAGAPFQYSVHQEVALRRKAYS